MTAVLAIGFCNACGYVAEVVKDGQNRVILLCNVCDARKDHKEECLYRKAVECPVGIECEQHGLQICLKCTPCTCTKKKSAIS